MKHMQVSKRDESFIRILSNCETNIVGYATVGKKSKKLGYMNVLLTDINFEYLNNTVTIQHCWLQESDYPVVASKALNSMPVGTKIKVYFKFYKYRDAIDRNMHGMKISYLERV